jgi:hypothetical protein
LRSIKAGGRIILEWIGKKQDRRASDGFTWPRIGQNNALYSARKIASEA